MYGKKLKISEYEFKFGAKDQMVYIFICFKYLKTGNKYLIFSNVGEESTGKINYGTIHMNSKKIVSMEPKDGSEEVIKEIIWKIINKEPLDDYEIIDIKDAQKFEIIAQQSLNMKPDVINKLVEVTIPKDKSKNNEEDNKNNSHGCLIFLLIILILGIAGMVAYDKITKYLGIGEQLTCEKSEANTTINAFINKKIEINYNRIDDVEKITENIAYNFSSYDNYYEFKETGTYYDFIPRAYEDVGVKWEDDTNTFRTIVTLNTIDTYSINDTTATIKGNVDEDMIIFQNQGYTCKKQKREE